MRAIKTTTTFSYVVAQDNVGRIVYVKNKQTGKFAKHYLARLELLQQEQQSSQAMVDNLTVFLFGVILFSLAALFISQFLPSELITGNLPMIDGICILFGVVSVGLLQLIGSYEQSLLERYSHE